MIGYDLMEITNQPNQIDKQHSQERHNLKTDLLV
jgi:hypothetical protein